MESVDNQRFNEALNFLLDSGIIKYAKDLGDKVGMNKDRIKYLKSHQGASISTDEFHKLKENFPEVNWTWVKLGEGSMLATANIAKEDAEMYAHKIDCKEDALAKILSGESCLPVEEQNKLLRREVLKLKDRIIKDSENKDPLKLLEEMKRMLGS